jgi:alkaline phosphatase
MTSIMKSLFTFLTFLWALGALAQPAAYTVNNAHSHNDYEQDIPFWMAYHAGFASIEADIFLVNGRLLVGHEEKYLQDKRSLQALYLDPIRDCIEKNNGYIFADTSKQLQLLIDIKSDSIQTLKKFIEVIEQYPSILACPKVKFVITGNRPASSLFNQYPAFISFDGEAGKTYSREALSRVAMMSADLKNYAGWNGKGRPVKAEFEALQSVVNSAHALHKPVRFWGAPDMINAWYQLMHLKVDFINTDLVYGLSSFLKRLDKTAFSPPATYKVYQPSYKMDGDDKRAKNVILLIGDGTGLAQLYAGYTANKGCAEYFQYAQSWDLQNEFV